MVKGERLRKGAQTAGEVALIALNLPGAAIEPGLQWGTRRLLKPVVEVATGTTSPLGNGTRRTEKQYKKRDEFEEFGVTRGGIGDFVEAIQIAGELRDDVRQGSPGKQAARVVARANQSADRHGNPNLDTLSSGRNDYVQRANTMLSRVLVNTLLASWATGGLQAGLGAVGVSLPAFLTVVPAFIASIPVLPEVFAAAAIGGAVAGGIYIFRNARVAKLLNNTINNVFGDRLQRKWRKKPAPTESQVIQEMRARESLQWVYESRDGTSKLRTTVVGEEAQRQEVMRHTSVDRNGIMHQFNKKRGIRTSYAIVAKSGSEYRILPAKKGKKGKLYVEVPQTSLTEISVVVGYDFTRPRPTDRARHEFTSMKAVLREGEYPGEVLTVGGAMGRKEIPYSLTGIQEQPTTYLFHDFNEEAGRRIDEQLHLEQLGFTPDHTRVISFSEQLNSQYQPVAGEPLHLLATTTEVGYPGRKVITDKLQVVVFGQKPTEPNPEVLEGAIELYVRPTR